MKYLTLTPHIVRNLFIMNIIIKQIALALCSFSFGQTTWAQLSSDSVTYQDYKRAESFLYGNTSKLVKNGYIAPTWMDATHFWYMNQIDADSSQIWIVDAKSGRKHLKNPTEKISSFNALSPSKIYPVPRSAVVSPNREKAVFIQDNNLWVENLISGQKLQLTKDGIQDFGYGTNNAGWTTSPSPVVRWSPDSKYIATIQMDERKVGEMYLVKTKVGHPELMQWKYPLPGDSIVPMIERVVINVDNGKMVRFKMSPDFHRGTLSDDISSSGTFDDNDWNPDDSELAFVSTSRDHKNEKFRIANTKTGDVKTIFEETVATQYESGQGEINWRYLSKTHEVIWYSERDDWGHLYLYDSQSGKLKHQITKGDWLVTRLLKVDATKRKLYFMAAGLESKNPYFQQFCSIDFSGKNFKILTPEIGDHHVSFSPDSAYFVDNYSQPDVPNASIARDLEGKKVIDLPNADITALKASGWKAPHPVKLIAADGKTDIYGLVFTPTQMQAGKKYPVVDYIYPGPQGGSVGSWSFAPSRGDNQSLAELGTIVVVVEGTSNPLRRKSFHDMSYGNMSINTLPDQVSAIRQLSQSFPMDTTKVGIWGHSGGGFATADAMFTYPDFFKVGISESGNHDNRGYEDDWGERYDGLMQNSDYAHHANQLYAKNLKGKLLLVTGNMDNNVPPYNTYLVVKALEDANKDFDLLIFPNAHHGYGQYYYYMMRRRWDYFVQNLLEKKHPKEFSLEN